MTEQQVPVVDARLMDPDDLRGFYATLPTEAVHLLAAHWNQVREGALNAATAANGTAERAYRHAHAADYELMKREQAEERRAKPNHPAHRLEQNRG